MQRKHLVTTGIAAAVVLGATTAATYALGGTESTTQLDSYSTVTVDGQKALAKNIVAGRIESKYHPLPWIGSKVTGVSCPTGLKAVTGTAMTCTAKGDGKQVEIPVSVVRAGGTSVTWKFER
ncbi:DUF4333 domain-containing protein [Streptomyces sp. NPDC002577]